MYKPRDYQAEAVATLKKAFKRRKKGTLVLPTGGGKTFTAWNFLLDDVNKGKKVLWIVHREYLIEQAVDGLRNNNCNAKVGFWTAKEKDNTKQITIAMVMSTSKLSGHYDWVVYDECHRAAALSYQQLESRITFDKKLGLSATPERLDKKDLDLGDILYQISFGELVKRGYLAKPEVHVIKTNQTFQFTVSGGDISRTALKRLNNKDRNEAILKHVLDGDLKNRKILIFGVDIDHVRDLKSIIDSVDRGLRCYLVHSEQKKEEKIQSLKRFKECKSGILCNCEVFTEGYDQPDITDIVLARSTVSRSLWVQMVGRGARIIKGRKESFKLWLPIDDLNKYSWLAREWVLDNTGSDIIDPDRSPESIERAIAANDDILQDYQDITLSTSEKLKMAGVISVKVKYSKDDMVFVIDDSRYKCLLLLKYYFENAPKSRSLKDYIELSYVYCVPTGEFSFKEWKDIAWQYYKHTVHGERSWHSNFSRRPSYTKEEIAKSFKANSAMCLEQENILKEKVACYKNFRTFWNHVVRKAEKYMPKTSKWVNGTVTGTRYKNRCFIIQTNQFKFSPSMHHFSMAIGKVLGEELEDQNLVVNLRLHYD